MSVPSTRAEALWEIKLWVSVSALQIIFNIQPKLQDRMWQDKQHRILFKYGVATTILVVEYMCCTTSIAYDVSVVLKHKLWHLL